MNYQKYCKLKQIYCDLATKDGYCMVTACINRKVMNL